MLLSDATQTSLFAMKQRASELWNLCIRSCNARYIRKIGASARCHGHLWVSDGISIRCFLTIFLHVKLEPMRACMCLAFLFHTRLPACRWWSRASHRFAHYHNLVVHVMSGIALRFKHETDAISRFLSSLDSAPATSNLFSSAPSCTFDSFAPPSQPSFVKRSSDSLFL